MGGELYPNPSLDYARPVLVSSLRRNVPRAALGLAVAVLFAAPPTAAADEAEYRRISVEMSKLASKNAWSGVERQYGSLIELGDPIQYDELILGAQAARALGDVTAAYERYVNAQRKQDSPEIAEAINEVESEFGRVELRVDPGVTPLTIGQMPFQPERITAIEFAQARLQQTGEYIGWLPVGDYELGIMPLEVRAGRDPLVEDVSTGASRTLMPSNMAAPVDGTFADWAPFLPGGGQKPARYGVKAGWGSGLGYFGAGFAVRPAWKYSFGVGIGYDPFSQSLSGAFDFRYKLPDPRFYVNAQLGSNLWGVQGSKRVFFGPSVGGGFELATGPLLVDLGVGVGMAIHPQGPRPVVVGTVAVGTNFD